MPAAPERKTAPPKPKKKKRAGKFLCVYDEVCVGHEVPEGHNEQPARIVAAIEIIQEIKAANTETVDLSVNEGHSAKTKWLELAHSPSYVAEMTQRLKRGRTLVQHATFVDEAFGETVFPVRCACCVNLLCLSRLQGCLRSHFHDAHRNQPLQTSERPCGAHT